MSSLEISDWPSKNPEAELIPYAAGDQAELRNNELQLIRGGEVQKCFGDLFSSSHLRHS